MNRTEAKKKGREIGMDIYCSSVGWARRQLVVEWSSVSGGENLRVLMARIWDDLPRFFFKVIFGFGSTVATVHEWDQIRPGQTA